MFNCYRNGCGNGCGTWIIIYSDSVNNKLVLFLKYSNTKSMSFIYKQCSYCSNSSGEQKGQKRVFASSPNFPCEDYSLTTLHIMLSPQQIINIQPAPTQCSFFREISGYYMYMIHVVTVVTHTFHDTVTVELCREHAVSLLTFTLREEGGDVATEWE